jgi:hypothetical protein
MQVGGEEIANWEITRKAARIPTCPLDLGLDHNIRPVVLAIPVPEEKNGRPVRIRTSDLYRVKVAL